MNIGRVIHALRVVAAQITVSSPNCFIALGIPNRPFVNDRHAGALIAGREFHLVVEEEIVLDIGGESAVSLRVRCPRIHCLESNREIPQIRGVLNLAAVQPRARRRIVLQLNHFVFVAQ